MDQELRLGIVYENNLDTDKFARMFNNKAQSYKFYWFEAILNLVKTEERDFTFEEVIDEMICEAYLMKRPYGHDGMPLDMAYCDTLSSQTWTHCERKCRKFSGACNKYFKQLHS